MRHAAGRLHQVDRSVEAVDSNPPVALSYLDRNTIHIPRRRTEMGSWSRGRMEVPVLGDKSVEEALEALASEAVSSPFATPTGHWIQLGCSRHMHTSSKYRKDHLDRERNRATLGL